MRRRLPLLLVLVLLVAALPVQAQGGDTLTVLCTPQEDWCVAMTQAFEAETGIATSYVRMSSGESLARLRATADNPEFSVWWGGPADAFIAAADEGLIEPYESPNAAVIDPHYRDAVGNTWTGVYVGALGFCSNKEILAELGVEPPTSWQDLLNPALQGNISVAHPATSGTAFTAFWTNVTLAADALERAAMEEQGVSANDITVGAGRLASTSGPGTMKMASRTSRRSTPRSSTSPSFTRTSCSTPAPAPRRAAWRARARSPWRSSSRTTASSSSRKASPTSWSTPSPKKARATKSAAWASSPTRRSRKRPASWYDWALTADAQAIAQTVNSLQLPTNPETPVSELSVNLSEVNLIRYNFEAAGLNRTDLVERFDAEIAPQPVE